MIKLQWLTNLRRQLGMVANAVSLEDSSIEQSYAPSSWELTEEDLPQGQSSIQQNTQKPLFANNTDTVLAE